MTAWMIDVLAMVGLMTLAGTLSVLPHLLERWRGELDEGGDNA